MTLAIQILLASALLLLNVRLAQWVVLAWLDYRDERRASDLMPRLIEAHKLVRDMTKRLKELETLAARIARHLWGRGDN